MNKTRHILSTLLDVDSQRGSESYRRVRTFPVLLGLANLFFCSYMDHYLKQDTGGHYLSLFLFVECSIMILITVGLFGKNGIEILLKTSIFPATRWSRMLFVFVSLLRKPPTIALLLTTLIFFVVLFYPSFIVAGLALLLYLLLVLNVLLLTAVVCVRLSALSHPVVSIAIVSVFTGAIILINSMVFHFTALLTSIPILSWAVNGVLAAQTAEIMGAILYCAYLTLSFIILLFIGRRIA